MAIGKKDRIRARRRALRVKSKIKQVSSQPRVSIFRSSKHIYAQIIDDKAQKTVASCSSAQLKSAGDKTDQARLAGLELAKRAKANGVESVVFDRGQFKYHGRVKALADGLREGGLKL
ncbi:MAG: 50S ribosomal protein L18 [Candidatus Dependentiae bacterium]|nr:50S ribosomal protein L18 [Candidatus Dependentiae bacterium]